jgi:predicted Zn-dependent peptidase
MDAAGTPEYYALSVLAFILAQGESSRLYRLLVHDNNWVTSLSVGPNQYKGPQLFELWLQLQNGAEKEIILKTLEEELGKICENKVLDQELEKARNQIAFNFINRLSKVSQVGELLAYYALYYGNAEMVNRDLARHLEVGQDHIIEAAQKVFRNENRTLLLVEPGQQ